MPARSDGLDNVDGGPDAADIALKAVPGKPQMPVFMVSARVRTTAGCSAATSLGGCMAAPKQNLENNPMQRDCPGPGAMVLRAPSRDEKIIP
jgi:hypothetical protein